MSYVVLARKWRPMDFDDLVGQDHVARTLGNAIASGRVAHAFLFTGVRGVGKTTSARILAKALNCMGDPEAEKPAEDPGPTVQPCLKCSACLEIAQGTDVDVREIDGASYNGVEEVRKLQDSLPYRPGRDRYKIIIVDEVHMLSQAAWNAFLKTLEEPPPHVKFIFATTEVHKVPITILSRVQRFDFKLIPAKAIADRLRYVLQQEGIDADETAIAILARQAAGSMRDGMSLLDQVIAFGGKELKGEDVARVLGVASRSALVRAARALVEGRPDDGVRVVGEVADQGFDIAHVTRDLLELLRDLVVAKVCDDPSELLDLADEELALVLELAKNADENDLLRLHHGFSKGYDDVVRGASPRANLEMLVVRLALRPPLLPIDELLHRIAGLERRLTGGGGGPGSAGGAGGAGGTGRRAQASAPAAGGSHASASGQAHRTAETKPTSGSSSSGAEAAAIPTPSPSTPPPSPTGTAEPTTAPEPTTAAEPTTAPEPTTAAEGPTQEPRTLSDERPPSAKGFPTPTLDPSSNTAPVSPEATRAAAELPAADRERLERLRRLTDELRAETPELAAMLDLVVPVVADDQRLRLALEPGFVFEKKLTRPPTAEQVETVAKKLWGQQVVLELVPGSRDATPEKTLAALRAAEKEQRHREAVTAVKNHPVVARAMSIFEARIKEVHVAPNHP